MEMEEHVVAIIIGLAGIALNLCVAMVGASWALGRANQKITTSMSEKIEETKDEIRDEIAVSQRFAGEAVAAVRTKVNEVELWTRDNLVSKHTFNIVIGEFRDASRRLEDKVELRFDKVDAKLDRMNNFHPKN